MKRLLFSILIASAAVTAMAKDIHTVVLTTEPQMHCAGCENKVTENLRYVRGVKAIKASAAEQTITVTIDADKTSAAVLIESLKKAGYTATLVKDVPAERAGKPVQPKKHEKK